MLAAGNKRARVGNPRYGGVGHEDIRREGFDEAEL